MAKSKPANTGWTTYPKGPGGSRNIAAVRWLHDGTESYLEVAFHSGKTYLYTGVPRTVYEALLAAPSKGTYHARHIKWVYFFRQV